MYKHKYLKYKNKYTDLKIFYQVGGLDINILDRIKKDKSFILQVDYYSIYEFLYNANSCKSYMNSFNLQHEYVDLYTPVVELINKTNTQQTCPPGIKKGMLYYNIVIQGSRFKFDTDLSGFKDDKDIISVAVKYYGLALQFASEALQSDKEVVLIAITNNGLALQFASKALRAEKEVVLIAITNKGLALEHVSEDFKSDRDLVLIAIKNNGLALEHASANFKADIDLVLIAITNNGLALKHASKKFKSDRGLVLIAIKNNGLALEHASAKFKADRYIVTIAINNNDLAFQHASNNLREDIEIFLLIKNKVNKTKMISHLGNILKSKYDSFIKIYKSKCNSNIIYEQQSDFSEFIKYKNSYIPSLSYAIVC